MSDERPYAFPLRSASEESVWMASHAAEVHDHAFPTTTGPRPSSLDPSPPEPLAGAPPESDPPTEDDVPLIDPAKEEEALAELQAEVEVFSQGAAALATARARALRDVEGQLISLAVDIAQCIVEREIEEHPELHQVLARAALETLGDPHKTELLASSDAFESLIDVIGEPFLELDGVRVPLRADPSLQGLGCVARSQTSQVDGRVRERLRAVRQSFADSLASDPTEEVE